ncbi:diguanylate cyclase domain-containing protein [Treponema sp.]|uniref:sensor domain-containing diguanylate cyclase n=1 Tax=Treponema sp. TaxID=166 RepID=UPI00389046AB
MKKKYLKSKIFLVFFIFLIGTGVFVLVSGRNSQNARIINFEHKTLNEGWYYYNKYGEPVSIPKLPAKIPSENSKSVIYHEISPFQNEDTNICFYSEHQNITVRLNGDVIYSFNSQANPKNFISYRAVHNFIKLPKISEDSVLSIETESLIKSSNGYFEQILFGTSIQVLFSIITNHIDNFLLGIMFIVTSIFLLGTNYLFTRNNSKDYTLFYLALLTFTIGLWQLDDSTLLLFFTGYLPLLWCFKYLTQLFMPLFTYLFIKSIIIKPNKKFMNIIFWIIIALVSTQTFLQLTGIKHLTNTIFASHFIYLTLCIYTLKSLSKEDWLKTSRLKYLFLFSMIISIFIFGYTALTLITNKFFSSTMSFGLALIFLSMILLTYQKELKLFESINKTETYKNLAFIDIATGANNKTAWYTLIDNFNESSPQGEYCLIIFDMNNLKKLNDELGHLVGDKVIKNFCTCLLNIIGEKGEVYRIGGDEFVCLFYNIYREAIMTILYQFDEAVKNQTEEPKFSAAYGLEFFKPHNTADFQTALNRADEKMYQTKSEMKLARK